MSARTLVVWCPDWPLVAAGAVELPAAVLRVNRVVASSASARREGVRLNQRRREAEAACPGLVVVADDPSRDVRAFEPVVGVIAGFTPRVEVSRPGVCSLPVRGPARYFGGEPPLADRLKAAVDDLLAARGGPSCRIGVADTPFVARLAARSDRIIPAGQTADWLADLPIEVIGPRVLTDLLRRLGIRRVGDLAGLDEGMVGARFGSEGARAHLLARGLDDHALALSDPPPDLSVSRDLDSPLEEVETVAFVAAGVADELVQRLAPRGLACTRLLVEASSEHAEELSRWWRADRPFTARAMVDRVRWQLEGWMASPQGAPSTGITFIRLTAGEVVADTGRQLGMFGGPSEASQRMERGIARIQGLLGHEAVTTAVLAGGRCPTAQVRLVAWGDPREQLAEAHHPWPGRIPAPSPSLVHVEGTPVAVLGADGAPVAVTGRGQCSSPPDQVLRGGSPCSRVTGWAGPWPVEERWWDPAAHRRRARLQVLLEDGSAHLLALEGGNWSIEATYD